MKWLGSLGLPEAERARRMREVATLWTYASTGLEGNTLTLKETERTIRKGRTSSHGRRYEEELEVIGHAEAIAACEEMGLGERPITEKDVKSVFAVMMCCPDWDRDGPRGTWKGLPNETGMPDGGIWPYPAPEAIPGLMAGWLDLCNEKYADPSRESYTKLHLSLVAIHPFFDGNGRMGRLLANLPRLKAGAVPIIIPRERRWEIYSAE